MLRISGIVLLFCMLAIAGEDPHSYDLSRPQDLSQHYFGHVELRPVGVNTVWPYFVDGQTGQAYKMRPCNDNCEQQIRKCAEGSLCDVKGQVLEGDETYIALHTVTAFPEEKIIRTPGHRFLSLEMPQWKDLDVAVRDESGTRWAKLKPLADNPLQANTQAKNNEQELPSPELAKNFHLRGMNRIFGNVAFWLSNGKVYYNGEEMFRSSLPPGVLPVTILIKPYEH